MEESSRKPHYLAIKFLYQGGQTEIVAVDVAQVPCLPYFSYFTSCNLIILYFISPIPPAKQKFNFNLEVNGNCGWVGGLNG